MKRTPELLQTAQLLHAHGATYKEIAAEIGISAMTIYAWLNPRFAVEHNERRKKRLIKGNVKYFRNLLCNARRDAAKGGFEPPAISPEQAKELWDRQDKVCALSGDIFGESSNEKSVLDHDHDNGIVRGFIKQRFNRGLGFFLHSPRLLRLAADYLEQAELEIQFNTDKCLTPTP